VLEPPQAASTSAPVTASAAKLNRRVTGISLLSGPRSVLGASSSVVGRAATPRTATAAQARLRATPGGGRKRAAWWPTRRRVRAETLVGVSAAEIRIRLCHLQLERLEAEWPGRQSDLHGPAGVRAGPLSACPHRRRARRGSCPAHRALLAPLRLSHRCRGAGAHQPGLVGEYDKRRPVVSAHYRCERTTPPRYRANPARAPRRAHHRREGRDGLGRSASSMSRRSTRPGLAAGGLGSGDPCCSTATVVHLFVIRASFSGAVFCQASLVESQQMRAGSGTTTWSPSLASGTSEISYSPSGYCRAGAQPPGPGRGRARPQLAVGHHRCRSPSATRHPAGIGERRPSCPGPSGRLGALGSTGERDALDDRRALASTCGRELDESASARVPATKGEPLLPCHARGVPTRPAAAPLAWPFHHVQAPRR
jgi:hypothetical protein